MSQLLANTTNTTTTTCQDYSTNCSLCQQLDIGCVFIESSYIDNINTTNNNNSYSTINSSIITSSYKCINTKDLNISTFKNYSQSWYSIVSQCNIHSSNNTSTDSSDSDGSSFTDNVLITFYIAILCIIVYAVIVVIITIIILCRRQKTVYHKKYRSMTKHLLISEKEQEKHKKESLQMEKVLNINNKKQKKQSKSNQRSTISEIGQTLMNILSSDHDHEQEVKEVHDLKHSTVSTENRHSIQDELLEYTPFEDIETAQ